MTICTTPCVTDKEISVSAGRHHTATFTLTTSTPSAGTPMDLTGASVWFTVKRDIDDEDADAKVWKRNTVAGGGDSEIDVTDETGGVLDVYIVPADTEDLDGAYWYDLVVENSSGRIIQAVEPSKFTVRNTVTKFD